MKDVVWEGNSLEVLREFPEGIRKDLGTALMFLQLGERPHDAKPIKTGMPGAWELRAKDASGQYRVIYFLMVKDTIHVLHCFKKKTQQTAKADLELARTRFKVLKREAK